LFTLPAAGVNSDVRLRQATHVVVDSIFVRRMA
jgi:hypothetical protein